MQKQIEHNNRMKEDEIEAEKALYKAGEDLKNARRHLEIVQLEQEQLLGEASDIDDEMSKYNAAIAKISAEINSAQRAVAETSQKISDVSSQMEQFNQTVVELKMQLTALSARLENSNHSLKRLNEFHADGLMRLELQDNAVEDITVLAGLLALDSVDLSNNQVADISPLVANTGLWGEEWEECEYSEYGDPDCEWITEYDYAYLEGNPLDCAAQEANIQELLDRVVYVTCDCGPCF